MPRVLVDCSEAWLARFHDVLPSAIDTLDGIDYQITSCIVSGGIDAADLLETVQSQLKDLSRSLQATRYIF